MKTDMKRRNRKKRSAKKARVARSRKRRTNLIPQTVEQYFAMQPHLQDRWTQITHVISKMRDEDVTIPQASRDFSLKPSIVRDLGADALRKAKNGRYTAKPFDDLLRVLVVPTSDGLREIGVRDSRQASVLGKYWAAVQKYLETGDASGLRRISRKTITDADGKRIRLIKDLAELDRLGSAGVMSFETIYAKAA